MGIQVVTIDKQHVCPMKDGNKPHKGGVVIEGVSGVYIDGKPVATVGNKCQCCSPKINSITSGAMGVLIDGKPIALVGSQTKHGGNIIEGVPGVTVSGGFATKSDQPEDFVPQIFNLQWKREEIITNWGLPAEKIKLTAEAVGYENGEEIQIKIYHEDTNEFIDEVKAIVQDNRIDTQWELTTTKKQKE